MAFTGTATVTQITDRMVRITGLSLGAGATGTVGLHGATGTAPNVTLPAAFQPAVYRYGDTDVQLVDSVRMEWLASAGGGDQTQIDTSKSGTTAADFRISMHNASGSASDAFEMYVSFHD